MEHTKILKERFDLDIALLRMKRKKDEADAALRQAKFDLREAQQAEVLYSGSFRHFLDKFTGKQEEHETALRHSVQRSDAALAAAVRTVSETEEKILQLEQSLSPLPSWDDLKTSDTAVLWCRLEALYCAEAVLPLLEITHHLLLERRNQSNGGNAGQIKTHYELADIYTAPETAANDCRPYILRLSTALAALEIRLPEHTFLLDPAVFLNTATKYTRFDRLNDAITQTEALIREIPLLPQRLGKDQ